MNVRVHLTSDELFPVARIGTVHEDDEYDYDVPRELLDEFKAAEDAFLALNDRLLGIMRQQDRERFGF